MNKLEVGMYVRFNYHRVTVPIQISKIKEKHYEDIEGYYYYLTDNGLVISEAQILKASFNIIDLIEEGDYVNGGEVIKIYEKGDSYTGNRNYVFKQKAIEVANDNYETIPMDCLFTNDEIESVITKEQFESMSYRIGE